MAEALFSPKIKDRNKVICLICKQFISKKAKKCVLGEKGWSQFQKVAKDWADIAIPEGHDYLTYTQVHLSVENISEPFGTVHTSCRSTFTSQSSLQKFLERCGNKNQASQPNEGEELSALDSMNSLVTSPVKQRLRSSFATVSNLCFICNKETDNDHLLYADGGITRCARDSAGKRLERQKDIYLHDKTHIYYEASRRLDLLLKGNASDIWAADIYTHKPCYISFAFPRQCATQQELLEAEMLVLQTFFYKIKQKILKEKCAFYLKDLLDDVISISEEMKLEEPVINNKRTLRRRIEDEFGDTISFNVRGSTLVYSSDTNPCDYAVAALHGCGLRDDDFVKAFGKMVKQKVQPSSEKRWPLTPEELTTELNRGPPHVLYNAIYATIEDTCKKNSFGYFATDSQLKATKIWSLASDWESLIRRETTGKQAVLGLVFHRNTASKEGINYLHKCNHTMSYNSIRLQNEAWARMLTNKSYCASSFRKGVTTHSTMDNNDGHQETIDGTGTTHDTNITMFQLPTDDELLLPTIGEQREIPQKLSGTLEAEYDVKPYYIGKLVGPPQFYHKEDEEKNDELQYCIKRDIAWAAAGSLALNTELDEPDYNPLGSWTAFMKQTSESVPIKCVQEFQPVLPHPPEYPICKKYLDSVIDIINDLEISHMFVHSDELVYSKLCHILWKNPELYKKIILLMGGFHQLRVMQKILYKRYNCRQMQQICVEAETIAKGSSDQAFEGRHYYRCLRVHKECFDAFVQLRIERLTDNHATTPPELLAQFQRLRRFPSSDNLNSVMKSADFKTLCADVLSSVDGTEGQLTVTYLRDISLTLALVSAVREGNFERHLQAERNMAGLCFAFDHPNYARYVSYQHVYLSRLKNENIDAYDDLVKKGFGASITGQTFSSIHGDLVTEYFNRTTKGTSGPFRAGYSRNTEAVNRWVKTIHIHSKLKEDFKNLLSIKTSSKHKEMTIGGKILHQKHVQNIKQRIKHLEIDPFATSPPISFSTGVEIRPEVVKDMLRADDIGKSNLDRFIKERLLDGSKSFFDPITKLKLNTGITKKKKKPRAVEVLKEDKQAFGLLVGKSVSNTEAFSYPLTSYPLSIATCEGGLYQGDKADFRNFLIGNSLSQTTEKPMECAWFVDGMAAMRTLKPASTYKGFGDSLIKFISSLIEDCNPTVVGLINDCYLEDSTKNCTRKGRGEAGSNVKISSINQTMLTGMRWKEFLHNSKNKEGLISIIARYIQSEEMRSNLPVPMIINDKHNTLYINADEISEMFECNHEEADYRLVLHALICKQDVVVVAKDTDVLVLLVWAYTHFTVQYKWYLMYEKGIYSDISIICEHFGKTLCENLLSFHAITGCDTASYMFRVGKVTVFQKLMKKTEMCSLLSALENDLPLAEDDVGDLQRFVQTAMYSGKISETYVETRIRLYDQQVKKTSANLPPDPDSLLQDLKRKQLQVHVWKQLDNVWINLVDSKLYGWRFCDVVGILVPIWFTGHQLPPSLRKNRRGKKRSSSLKNGPSTVKRALKDSDAEFADGELSDIPTTRRKSKENELPSTVYSVPIQTIVYESSRENEGEDEREQTEAFKSESSDWEVSDFYTSNDSGSDYEWVP